MLHIKHGKAALANFLLFSLVKHTNYGCPFIKGLAVMVPQEGGHSRGPTTKIQALMDNIPEPSGFEVYHLLVKDPTSQQPNRHIRRFSWRRVSHKNHGQGEYGENEERLDPQTPKPTTWQNPMAYA
jgi:hypothetical protein